MTPRLKERAADDRGPGDPPRARKRAVGAAIAIAIAVTGCGGSGGAEEGSAEDPSAIAIAVSNYPTTSISPPYVVGVEHGMFQDAGIEIEKISGSGGGGETVRSVLAGRLPFGDVAPSAAAQAFISGAPVVIVGGSVQSVGDIKFVTNKDSSARSMDDLSGETVGYTEPGSVTQAVLELSLEAGDVDPASVETRAMGGLSEGLTALQGGSIAAAPNVEPVYAGDPDPYRVLWEVPKFVPAFQQTVVITSQDILEQSPELVRDFLAARANAVDYIEANPREAAELWAQEAGLEPDVAQTVMREYLANDQWGVGLSLEGLRAADKSMHQLELVEPSADVPWDEMIDQSLLPEGAPEIDPAEIGAAG